MARITRVAVPKQKDRETQSVADALGLLQRQVDAHPLFTKGRLMSGVALSVGANVVLHHRLGVDARRWLVLFASGGYVGLQYVSSSPNSLTLLSQTTATADLLVFP